MTRRTAILLGLVFVLPAGFPTPLPFGKSKTAQASQSTDGPHFAFWYEDWKPGTWEKLQPATHLIGVPAEAVNEIHTRGGKALNYVTVYQSVFGTAFLRDREDLPAVGFHTPQGYLPSAFGGANNYVLCSNSKEMHRRALDYVNHVLARDRFDGLFIDNAYQPPATLLICDATHAHASSGENGGSAFVDLLSEIYTAAKRMNPSALIVTNTGNPTTINLQSHGYTLWDFSDYLVWESYGYASAVGPDHDRWGETIKASFDLAKSSNAKKVLALSYPKNEFEAFYSYAVAKTFGFKYAENLGVSEEGKEGSGGHYGLFASKLPRLSEFPVGPPPLPSSPVLRREYDNGICVVNTRSSDYRLTAARDGTAQYGTNSLKVRKNHDIRIPAGKAMIFVY